MGDQTMQQSGMSMRDVAAAAGSTHTRVLRLIGSGLWRHTAARNSIPRDVGQLIASVVKADIASPSTGELMRTDPAQILEGALALAELARRELAEQVRQTKAAAQLPEAA